MSAESRFELRLIGWSFGLNLAWELAQSRLYSDHARGLGYLLWTRFHCTLGDVLILLGAFWGTAALYRSWRWPAERGLAAAVLFVGLGLAYTIWSEWFNTSVRGAWAYAAEMPKILGIGLTPLLQWALLPSLLLWILRSVVGSGPR